MSKSSETPDYYAVLQLDPNAEQLVVTKVYRLLAAYYHPDNKQTGDEEKFKQVLEAYEVLSDPAKRSRYDQSYIGTGKNKTQDSAKRGREIGCFGRTRKLKSTVHETGGKSRRSVREYVRAGTAQILASSPI